MIGESEILSFRTVTKILSQTRTYNSLFRSTFTKKSTYTFTCNLYGLYRLYIYVLNVCSLSVIVKTDPPITYYCRIQNKTWINKIPLIFILDQKLLIRHTILISTNYRKTKNFSIKVSFIHIWTFCFHGFFFLVYFLVVLPFSISYVLS